MRAPRGFTLIELLVALALMSLLMLGTVSALYSAGLTESRVDARIARLEEQRAIQQFLQHALSQVSSGQWKHPSLPPGSTHAGLLVGERHIEWVGTFPPRHGAGGRHYFRVGLEPAGLNGESALVLRYVPWQGAAPEPDAFPDWDGAPARVLATGVTALQIRARAGWPPSWHPQSQPWSADWQVGWPHIRALPEEIELQWADGQGPWPPLRIGIHPAPGSAEMGDGFTIGGSAR